MLQTYAIRQLVVAKCFSVVISRAIHNQCNQVCFWVLEQTGIFTKMLREQDFFFIFWTMETMFSKNIHISHLERIKIKETNKKFRIVHLLRHEICQRALLLNLPSTQVFPSLVSWATNAPSVYRHGRGTYRRFLGTQEYNNPASPSSQLYREMSACANENHPVFVKRGLALEKGHSHEQ